MPTLPTELERLIFEIAAITHPYCMPSMLRVAHRIKIWIEPLLYSILTILPESGSYPETKPVFVRRIPDIHKLLGQRPAAFLRQHVRHVCFVGFPPDDLVLQLLSICDATVDLNLAFPSSSTFISLLGNLLPRRLCIDIDGYTWHHVSSPRFMQPCFSHLSHLHLYGTPDRDWATWSGLGSVPRLTHLSSKTPHQWPSGTARSRNARSSRYSSFYATLPLPSRYLPRTSQLAPIRVSSTFVWRIISPTGSAVHVGARITGPEQTQWSMPGGALRPNPNVDDS
ncbi:hypothetical protein B0H13DRAFT_2671344 [Mycena leptocephala]|nr:hypothetical protein B0H13DRAFT_2671344 [Mycena leptocephala]